jgi:hypothetical protein
MNKTYIPQELIAQEFGNDIWWDLSEAVDDYGLAQATVYQRWEALEAKGVPFQHDDYRIMRQTHEQLAKGEAI